jgi:NAD-dependent DNA ligase
MPLRPEDPRISHFLRDHRTERGLDQLLGYCQGVLADGHVSMEEATTLHTWIRNNWDLRDQWPANVLFERLDAALSDGSLAPDEQRDLIETILSITGGPLPGREDARSTVTDLPLCRPPPTIAYPDRNFVATGTFAFGKRSEVESLIVARGGKLQGNVAKSTHYLIIGALGSENWKHASFGRKILAAVDWKAQGCPIAIVSEEHWSSHG